MFTCAQCHLPCGPGIGQTKKVVETRPKEYENVVTSVTETGRVVKETVKSKGWEIVKEVAVCPSCVAKDSAETKGQWEATQRLEAAIKNAVSMGEARRLSAALKAKKGA